MPDPTLLTAERLRELLHYDPDTGAFTWRSRRGGRANAGTVAGSSHPNGYILIRVDSRRWWAHRLAWLWMLGRWPSREVDHKDTDPSNNRWSNLRLATSGENSQNQQRPSRRNTTGFLGVSFDKHRNKYSATIGVDGRCIHLGRFQTAEQAYEAYLAAKRELHPFGML